jgi:cystathionine beta-lyase/cystathionine gamma-synthase
MKNNISRKHWDLSTRINHPQRYLPGETNPPLLTPIYQSVKFVVDPGLPYYDQFIYSRLSNPNVKQLEMTLADIQQKEDCLVYASGIAAISATMLSLLKAGDHIITFRELYKPARMLIRDLLPNFGIESSILKLSEIEKLEVAIIPGKTKLIHFESPTNPNLEIANIEEIIRIARKHDVIVSMDGTFAGLHQHTQFDIDLMINSLTKFANGHGDVLAGSVAGKKHLIQKIRYMSITLGATLDPHAAFLVERGLKTYLLRVERHAKNAMKVAQFLASHPKIEKVFYPGLETHPNHALAKKQMSDMGAVVSFVLKEAKAEEFCSKLGMIQMAVSLGATESIICPTHFFFGDDLNTEEKVQMGISHHSLRLSVGLEDADDIIADLKQAL